MPYIGHYICACKIGNLYQTTQVLPLNQRIYYTHHLVSHSHMAMVVKLHHAL